MPLAIAGVAIGAGSAVGAIGSYFAGNAQAKAATNAANLDYQAEQNALGLQTQEYNNSQAEAEPYLAYGTGALSQLASGLGVQAAPNPTTPVQVQSSAPPSEPRAGSNIGGSTPFVPESPLADWINSGHQPGTYPPAGWVSPVSGELAPAPPAGASTGGQANTGAQAPQQAFAQPALDTNGALNPTSLNEQWATPFTAPTAAQAAATPGEQFALQQGEQAIQNSAAAQGSLLTGGTEKDLNNYAQNEASTYYQQAYNNAMQGYLNNYNVFQNNQTSQYNKLASLAGVGQQTAQQLAGVNANFANNASNTIQSGTAAQTNQLNNAAAATASGYVGSANAISSGLSNFGDLAMLYDMNKNKTPAQQPTTTGEYNLYG
ncbi:MAG: hypothetical protein ACRD3D_01020 [Terriglobia bacterium]